MYDIESASISEVNRIYNNIIECFGFTLSTASAMVCYLLLLKGHIIFNIDISIFWWLSLHFLPILNWSNCLQASIELIKVLQLKTKYGLNDENVCNNANYFYNLSDLGVCVTSESKRPNKTKLSNTCDLTEWDQWILNESEGMSTLEDVLNELRVRSGSVCTMMVMDDSKSIYLPDLFPHHLKRKKQTMRDIIANYYPIVPQFVTLSVSFESEEEEISGPNIKYIFTQNSN